MAFDEWPGIGYWDFRLDDPGGADVPSWANDLFEALTRHEPSIRSTRRVLKSDEVLAWLASDLRRLGYRVEDGKRSKVLLRPGVQLQVDAFHPDLRVVLEVEAVRAQLGGAFYRDVFRMLLLGKSHHGAIVVPMHGTQGNRRTNAFDYCYRQLAALAATGHPMPFSGMLLLGY